MLSGDTQVAPRRLKKAVPNARVPVCYFEPIGCQILPMSGKVVFEPPRQGLAAPGEVNLDLVGEFSASDLAAVGVTLP